MGYLGRRIGKSQTTANPQADGNTGGILDLFSGGYFQRTGNMPNAPGLPPIQGLTATGGVISDYTSGPAVYRAHVFTSSGTFTVSALANTPALPDSVEYLVVAGGGGGGGDSTSGGGGAGGLRTNLSGNPYATSTLFPVSTSPGSYTVTIGAGGVKGIYPSNNGSAGVDSVFGTITSSGGGYGGKDQTAGGPGGSGGGACGSGGSSFTGGSTVAVTTPSPWSGPSVQGYVGGNNKSTRDSPYTSGGGGGAGGAGVQGTSNAGPGGPGIQVAIAGPPTTSGVGALNPGPGEYQWFSGGGGGASSAYGGSNGTGGAGGGGSGGVSGTSGIYSTGAGGGGGSGGDGGSGGSGIVVVRYQIASLTAAAKATGGAISFYSGKTIHTFLGSGTFTMPGSYPSTPAQVLVVAGGGSGGARHGGGGGGGGLVHLPLANGTLANGTYNVVVGGGGAATRGTAGGIQGSNSSFGPPSSASAPTHIL